MKRFTRREAVQTGAAIAVVGATVALGLPAGAEAKPRDEATRRQDQERRLIAAYRHMGPIMQQVFFELAGFVVNGTAPAPALWLGWCQTKLAEIEAGYARRLS